MQDIQVHRLVQMWCNVMQWERPISDWLAQCLLQQHWFPEQHMCRCAVYPAWILKWSHISVEVVRQTLLRWLDVQSRHKWHVYGVPNYPPGCITQLLFVGDHWVARKHPKEYNIWTASRKLHTISSTRASACSRSYLPSELTMTSSWRLGQCVCLSKLWAMTHSNGCANNWCTVHIHLKTLLWGVGANHMHDMCCSHLTVSRVCKTNPSLACEAGTRRYKHYKRCKFQTKQNISQLSDPSF